jgi:hypothetical protein
MEVRREKGGEEKGERGSPTSRFTKRGGEEGKGKRIGVR